LLPRAAISWSGGKDSYLALHRSRTSFDVVALITMFGEDGERSRSHGLRPVVLEQQAARLGLPLFAGRGSWAGYETAYRDALARVGALGITHVIFGDIMYDSNREFPERVCAAERVTAVEPLWGEPTADLYREFVSTGADARIVTVRDGVLGAEWLGRRLTGDLLPAFIAAGVDPCGEHGEYHTVVVNAPLFSAPLDLAPGEQVLHSGCWALDFTVRAGEGGTDVPPLRDGGIDVPFVRDGETDVDAGRLSRLPRGSHAPGV
jgi:diphthine-ammonia ligase